MIGRRSAAPLASSRRAGRLPAVAALAPPALAASAGAVAASTSLASTGPAGGDGTFDATFRGASPDGSQVFVETKEQLVGADADSRQDVCDRG